MPNRLQTQRNSKKRVDVNIKSYQLKSNVYTLCKAVHLLATLSYPLIYNMQQKYLNMLNDKKNCEFSKHAKGIGTLLHGIELINA